MGKEFPECPPSLPDEDALAVVAFPDAAVAFIGYSKNVWREFPQMVLGVQVHPLQVIQTRDLLVWVDSCQDAADVSLKTAKERHFRFSVCIIFPFFLLFDYIWSTFIHFLYSYDLVGTFSGLSTHKIVLKDTDTHECMSAQ